MQFLMTRPAISSDEETTASGVTRLGQRLSYYDIKRWVRLVGWRISDVMHDRSSFCMGEGVVVSPPLAFVGKGYDNNSRIDGVGPVGRN